MRGYFYSTNTVLNNLSINSQIVWYKYCTSTGTVLVVTVYCRYTLTYRYHLRAVLYVPVRTVSMVLEVMYKYNTRYEYLYRYSGTYTSTSTSTGLTVPVRSVLYVLKYRVLL